LSNPRRLMSILLLGAVAALSGCNKNLNATAYALVGGGKLVSFTTAKPSTINSTVTLSGLPLDSSTGLASEYPVQIAYRPADQQLYAITSANHVYVVDPGSGAVTAVGGGTAFSSSTLSSPQLSVDPVADTLRILSSDQNLVVTPDTAQLQRSGTQPVFSGTDTNAGRTPSLAGIAYDNATAGASSTTLYALDATTQSLVQVGSRGGSPVSVDNGTLYTVGGLGVPFGVSDGFALDPRNNTAYAALAPSGGVSSLYTVDLGSGAASRVGTIGDGSLSVTALAIAPQ